MHHVFASILSFPYLLRCVLLRRLVWGCDHPPVCGLCCWLPHLHWVPQWKLHVVYCAILPVWQHLRWSVPRWVLWGRSNPPVSRLRDCVRDLFWGHG